MKESKSPAPHSPSAVTMSQRRESRGIDKTSGPAGAYGAIRVIHIFAPKVIKTDVANFRALVQKLTGRPTSSNQAGKSTRGRSRKTSAAGASTSVTAAGCIDVTTCMRSPTSTSISSSVETSTFEFESSSSVNTSAHRHQSSAAIADFEFDQKFQTRSGPLNSNSQGSASLFSAPDSSMTSSAQLNWFELEFSGRLQYSSPSSSSSFVSEPLSRDQMFSANGIEAAEDRLISCPAARSSSCSSWNESGSKSSPSIMVDPMQSLSGYKDNVSCSWSSPEASSCNSWSQEQEDTDFELRHQRNECNAATLSSGRRTTSSNDLVFSEMEILAGLVSPGHHPPLPEVNTLPPPLMSDYTSSNNSFSLEHFLFPIVSAKSTGGDSTDVSSSWNFVHTGMIQLNTPHARSPCPKSSSRAVVVDPRFEEESDRKSLLYPCVDHGKAYGSDGNESGSTGQTGTSLNAHPSTTSSIMLHLMITSRWYVAMEEIRSHARTQAQSPFRLFCFGGLNIELVCSLGFHVKYLDRVPIPVLKVHMIIYARND
ncbi:hypothetical protein R1sor_015115 [Riccia sorocarpa]|uniref:VQ domain-containing protein n=1 Tax=Riccia sorocarpa TaxID=122646 RepID=A0ABD3HD66_9MARC